jgi:hypothetical protein
VHVRAAVPAARARPACAATTQQGGTQTRAARRGTRGTRARARPAHCQHPPRTGQNVGGCNDGPGVMTLHREGKLLPLLKQAGALAA